MGKTLAEIIGYIEEEDLENEIEAFYKWREAEKRIQQGKKERKDVVHINLISAVEMKAHTEEMRSEMDRKFVECLIVAGLTKLDAIRRAKVWNAEWDSMKHGN